MSAIEKQKETARFWFETLRDRIVAAFETIENEAPGTLPAGRFQQTPWTRENDGGGGVTATTAVVVTVAVVVTAAMVAAPVGHSSSWIG